MANYIDRDKVIKAVEKMDMLDKETKTKYEYDKEGFLLLINLAPTADVEEVKHGKWEECFEDWRKQIVGDECSACGFRHYGTSISDYHYCPNCGAKMDLESD